MFFVPYLALILEQFHLGWITVFRVFILWGSPDLLLILIITATLFCSALPIMPYTLYILLHGVKDKSELLPKTSLFCSASDKHLFLAFRFDIDD